MVTQIKSPVTVDEFFAFIEQPENSDKIFEFIAQEIVEVPSNPYVSKIAAKILTFIGMYLLTNDIGHVTGADGGYQVAGGLYAPDVAFISYERQPELVRKGYNPNPPELAVEVISDPSNAQEQRYLRLKLSNYLAVDVTVWVVNAEDRRIEVHAGNAGAQELDETGVLTVEHILPGFQLPVKDIFGSNS
jgi:Uma2 family endonuclease